MKEVVHFTKSPEIQSFAEVKVSPNDNVYGVTWANVVKKYLQTAYSGEEAQSEVEAFGKTYKVLRRTEVTAFYDNDGNTLFDVTNDRLADEYGYLFGNLATEAEETEDDNESSEEGTPFVENGEHEKEAAQDEPEENGEVHTEVERSVEESTQKGSVYIGVVGAVTKLQEELKKAKEKDFAKPVIEHLIERCKDSESLASDVCQDHKTWEKCYKYIYEQARKQLKGSSGVVRDDVVYEWSEDYYHRDDKAEEAQKAKKAKERRRQQDQEQKKRIDRMEKRKKAKENEPKSAEGKSGKKVNEARKNETESKSKKNKNDIDGQMDLFSFISM